MKKRNKKRTHVWAIATDVPIIRYAEILLAYAEAKAEPGEMTEGIWNQTIKPLRERLRKLATNYRRVPQEASSRTRQLCIHGGIINMSDHPNNSNSREFKPHSES